MNSDKRPSLEDSLCATASRVAAPLNVLVVDDSAVVRQALTTVLSEKRGFCVAVAADPLIAMEKMKKFTPDVILLDLEMPRMDGMTFLEKLMTQSPVPVPLRIPNVVMNGLVSPPASCTVPVVVHAVACVGVTLPD